MATVDLGTFGAEAVLDTGSFDSGLSNIDSKMKRSSSSIGGWAKTIGKVAAGAVAGLATAAGGAFAAANKVAGSLDDIAKGAERAGVSTDFYQELDYWASQNGISHEQMEKAVGRFNQRLGQAQNGNEKYSTALQQMGIDLDAVREGTLSTEDAFAQSIQSLSEMENQQDQVNTATEMFGTRLARDMLPALQDGALSMDEAREKAQELGLVMEEDAINAGVKFADTWDTLKRTFEQVGLQIGNELIPVFQGLMDWVLENMPAIQDAIGTAFDVIGTAFETVVEWIGKFKNGITELVESNDENLTILQEMFVERFTVIWEFIQEILNSIKEFWQENGQTILDNTTEIYTQIQEIIQVALDYILEITNILLGEMATYVGEKLSELGVWWNEHGDTIMEAVDNALSFIQEVFEFVMPIIQQITEDTWAIIESVFDTAIGVILGLIETFAGLLTGDFETMKEGLIKIWESLFKGMDEIASGAWSLIEGSFSILWDSISGWFGDLATSAYDWGVNMIQGFIDGMVEKSKDLFDVSDNIISGVMDYMAFFSPSRKGEGRFVDRYGGNMLDSWLDGFHKKEGNVIKASKNLMDKVAPSMDMNSKLSGNAMVSRLPQQLSGNSGSVSSNNYNTNNDTKNLHFTIQNMNVSGDKKGGDDVVKHAMKGFENMGFSMR